MSFYTSKSNYTRTYNKPTFLKIVPGGTYVVRILQETAVSKLTHWFNGSVECLGEDCPVCAMSKKIRYEDPENFRKNPNYKPQSERVSVNVLDRSMVKVCTNCKEEVHKINDVFPSLCIFCNSVITSVEPHISNKVKVLQRGGEFFNRLNLIDKSKINASGERVGITGFDLVLMATRNDLVPMPTDDFSKIELPEDTFYDLENIIIKVNADEMTQLMRGVSLKDIFAARKALASNSEKVEKESKVSEEEHVVAKTLEELEKEMSSLFN